MSLELENAPICSTCPYCGVGCGVVIETDEQGQYTVKGDETHPANFGKLCSKGSALAETLSMEDRLLYPQIAGERVSWDAALDKVAAGFSETIKKHGPDSVAFYVSGQLLTEDYYIANKLMKGYIGSANIDTNSRLCMASSVVGHKRAFGADTVPGCYEDLEQTDLLILTGSNLAWCHPILYQRILRAKDARPEMKIIVIDPRETASCDQADLHLALAPGSDIALFQGLFKFLHEQGLADTDFIENHTENFDAIVENAAPWSLSDVAEVTELSEESLTEFYRMFAATEKVVTVYSQGINQATDGTNKVNSIINAHLLTGRIGKVGAGPFSITGQPNAMGGREVGGLANQLASHMEIGNPDHRDLVQRYWDSPVMAQKAGLLAVDLFNAIDAGDVKAVWIMATNPVDSLPNADFVKAALQKCDLVVVSDIYGHTDTVACADIVLPSTGWSEKDGTVTNSERRMSKQTPFLPAPGETEHDWWQLCEVGKRMGFEEGFSFDTPSQIFREYAGLCGFENNGTRDLDLSGLVDISDAEYDALKPIQWPVTKEHPNGLDRFFKDHKYFTPSRKAKFVSPASSDKIEATEEYPFVLNTGRIRDHWHTMTRTGRSARLSQHISEPYVEIEPSDAKAIGVGDADIATLSSEFGEMKARVVVTERQRAGSIFVPIHFTDSFSSTGRVDVLVHMKTDEFSGQPASKSTPVKLSKYDAGWYGFVVLAGDVFESIQMPSSTDYWAKVRVENGVRAELAGSDVPASWTEYFQSMLGDATDVDILEMLSPSGAQVRFAAFRDDKLIGLLYTSDEPVAVSRAWAASQLLSTPEGMQRHRLLAGRPGADMPEKGAIICSCMNVGVNDIRSAIGTGCLTVDAISGETTAGTNCGSCLPEIRAILKEMEALAAE